MEYTVQKLAVLAGVSARTLRYYDQIGLLTPARVSSSGYRIYGPAEVDTLQQILFYRELGVPLEQIAAILREPDFDRLDALRGHLDSLLERRDRIDQLILNVGRSIAAQERSIPMSDKQKFEGFKKELIQKNEAAYGTEIREKYGDEVVDASNAKMLHLTEEQYKEMEETGQEVLRLLDQAFDTGKPDSEAAQKAAEAHKKWLGYSWGHYSPEAHAGLVDMYVADQRFAAYYDRGVPGKANFLRQAVRTWLGMETNE